MSSFNRIILMGNLTRDPEVRQSQTGTYIVKAGLAVNERMPDGQGGWKEEASFFDIVIFGKRAEAFSRFMRKGRPVLVEGKLRQNRWQDKETGQNRSKIEVIVDNWEFAGGRSDEAGGGAPQQQAASAPDFPGSADFSGQPAQQSGNQGQAGNVPGSGASFPDDVPF